MRRRYLEWADLADPARAQGIVRAAFALVTRASRKRLRSDGAHVVATVRLEDLQNLEALVQGQEVDHVVVDEDDSSQIVAGCGVCGSRLRIARPVGEHDWQAAVHGFAIEHSRCPRDPQ